MAWEKTAWIDSWNWYKSTVTSVENAKTNKSTVTVTGQLHIAGSLSADNGVSINVPGNSKYLGTYVGAGDYYVSNTYDITHEANGTKTATISANCNYSWGVADASQTITFPTIDRNPITISNYTLKECKQRKLSINFTFNYAPSSTKYRYKKQGASSWETDWIDYDTYGGSYDSNTKSGYFTTPKLQANTNYEIEIRAVRSHNDVVTTKSGTFYVECSVFLKKNGSWVDGEVYIKKNGEWKKGTVYIKKSGVWKEAG